jgi:hypothetical protein
MDDTVVDVDVSKVARLQRALKWASGTKQVSLCVVLEYLQNVISTF